MTNETFTTLPLSDAMVANLETLGYTQMTPIQQASLPLTLQGCDLIAKAKTGSGKTAAFGIALLHKLNVKRFRIQTMVLCPTRELADQVAQELRRLARFTHNIKITTLCGGTPYKPQVHSLSHQAHIVVGTPGRVLQHLKEGSFSPKEIDTLVLDEADRMLEMGFSEDIRTIIDFLPKQRQTMLFSATYPENIEKLSRDIMREPEFIRIDTQHEKRVIEQHFYRAKGFDEKADTVIKTLQRYEPSSCVVFCNTKLDCDDLGDDLEDHGIDTLVLHSDFEQKERDECLTLFAGKSYPVLVATDVAARGLDIDDIELVINFDLPGDFEVYTHRIGRTARAGKSGRAVSLVQGRRDEAMLQENIDDPEITDVNHVAIREDFTLRAEYTTIFINGGKKGKLRAGDILGALTKTVGLHKDDVGKITVYPHCSYVAVKNGVATQALQGLSRNRIKKKFYRVFKK